MRLLEHWHLLSLDAPTVAIVWSWAFASATGVPFHTLSALLLGLATWLLYVSDRLLDSRRILSDDAAAGMLRERHYFHARYRRGFLSVALPALCLLAWLVYNRMDHAPRLEDLILSGAAAIYLLLVHLPFRMAPERMLPGHMFSKEAAVAVIFSVACIIPSWSRQPAAHGWLVGMGIPFALLCWLNCVGIEIWESVECGEGMVLFTKPSTRSFRVACIVLASIAFLLAIAAAIHHHPAVTAVLSCVAISALLLLRLDRRREKISLLQLRAAADAVLLTPLVFLLVRYLSTRL